MRKTQNHFNILKNYLKKEFVHRINMLEEKMNESHYFDTECLEELINLK